MHPKVRVNDASGMVTSRLHNQKRVRNSDMVIGYGYGYWVEDTIISHNVFGAI